MRQELNELNDSLGEDVNGMTVHEKLDKLLKQIATEEGFSKVSTSSFTVPESLNNRRGILVCTGWSSSSSNPAGMTIGTNGLVVEGTITIANNAYNKSYIYYGKFKSGQTLTCANKTGDGAAMCALAI